MSEPNARRRPATGKSALIAVLLSFLWPGLGHLYQRRVRPAVVFALPVLLLLLVVLWQARDGADILAARLLLVPIAAFFLVLMTLILAGWRLAAMTSVLVEPSLSTHPPRSRSLTSTWRSQTRRTIVTFLVLASVVVGMHGLVAWTGLAFLQGFSRVYVSGPQQTPEPGATQGDLGVLPTPYVTPKPDGRINVLLVGADSGLGYSHSLTDTLMLVSVDPVAMTVDMLSLPRDISQFPLFSGGTFSGKINSLASYAEAHPSAFPDGGFGTLTREVGYLLGAPVHYYAYVDLAGFQAVIDAVGGVDIVNPKKISDPGYGFPDGTFGFFLAPGPHHLTSKFALAYVRSRNGPGDNDFTRARRQQGLLTALKAQLTKPANLTNLPAILTALSKAVQTSYPAEGVPDLLLLAKQIPESGVTGYVLGPPYARQPAVSTGTYQLIIDEARFAALSIRLFGTESRYYAAPSASPRP
ncbi:MAG: LCP family protein [Chloroflexota bacterium]